MILFTSPDPAAQQAAVEAWKHHHPLFILGISTGISLLVIVIVVMIRWLISKDAWRYHPGGAGGFLKDEFARWAVAIGPILLVGIALKYYIYAYRPDLDVPNTWMIYAGCMIVIRMVARRLPYVKAVARHIDNARAQARQVKSGAQP